MPSFSLITKFALAAGALVQPALGLPSSSVRPSATSSRPHHSSSRVSHSIKPTSTAAPLNGTYNPDLPKEAACLAIAVEQVLFTALTLEVAEVAGEDPTEDEILTLFAKEDPLPAELVYDCLSTVPINKTAATNYIKFLKPYVEFQSTLGWLKNPPASYQQPAIDIIGGLDKISSDVSSGKVQGQYDFEVAISKLVQGSHDGHFAIPLPLLNTFPFVAPYKFVSVSEDGVKLPEVYVATDFGAANTSAKAPSAIKTINGKPAADFMVQFAKDKVSGYIDPQTDWNQLFVNSAARAGGALSTFEGFYGYPGYSNLTLTFANGTTVSRGLTAPVRLDFTEIATGQDVYDKFVAPVKEVPEVDATTEEPAKKPSVKEWGAPYPTPVLVQKNLGAGGFLTGYFLNKSSIAVIALNSFAFDGEEDIVGFAKAVEEFLAKCKSSGMKKLIIDLQANGGGTILTGYELFRQLFPTLTPFGGNQFRVPKSVDLIGSAFGSANASVQEALKLSIEATSQLDPYYYPAQIDINNKPFQSWASLNGLQMQSGDRISNTFRENISAIDDQSRQAGLTFPRPAQVFAAKDILLLTDGSCGSTCTIFAESMHTQAGVKVVVAGGPPQPGPMQGIAGVRGSRLQKSDAIDIQVGSARELNLTLSADLLPSNKSIPLKVETKSLTVNLLNQIRLSKQDVPLHFVYQAADCRIFYTAKMLADYSNLWQYAADALWTNPGLCVQGSTGHPSAAQNVTTTTAISKTNGTGSNIYITTNGAGSSNSGLSMALFTGAIVSFAALLL